jgi:hypothetical protein
MEAATYQALFSGIKEEPKPVFAFDVPALVLSRLPAGKARSSPDPVLAWLVALLVVATIGIPLFLFRKNLENMFGEVSAFFLYAILAAAIIIVLFTLMDMYKKHQKQMKALNFY